MYVLTNSLHLPLCPQLASAKRVAAISACANPAALVLRG